MLCVAHWLRPQSSKQMSWNWHNWGQLGSMGKCASILHVICLTNTCWKSQLMNHSDKKFFLFLCGFEQALISAFSRHSHAFIFLLPPCASLFHLCFVFCISRLVVISLTHSWWASSTNGCCSIFSALDTYCSPVSYCELFSYVTHKWIQLL